MSAMRKRYAVRLVLRCLIFTGCIALLFFRPKSFAVLDGMNFFKIPSLLHLLWMIWVIDMLLQIIPIKKQMPLGSQKLFANRFIPAAEPIKHEALQNYITSATRGALKVFILWCILIAAIGILYHADIIDKKLLFLISVFFYVCDLICVLIWCPFRLIMKTRCCTTCRIFNWDHLMMFSPLIFAGGFFALSLVGLSAAVFLVWEACILLHPERFWERSNIALQCAECTEKLCSQYCQKLHE